jgi:hypothetical protein
MSRWAVAYAVCALLVLVLPSVFSGGPFSARTFPFLGNSAAARDAVPLATAVWKEMNTTGRPPITEGGALTYDAKDGYSILFGGKHFSPNHNVWHLTNDTWKYVARKWTFLRPTVSPPARDYSMITFDAKDGYVVLYGGATGSGGVLRDTWMFAAGNWTNITNAASPPPRANSSFAYDPSDHYSVLYGGVVGGRPMNETWTFSGGNWTNVTTSLGPGPRTTAGLTFDPKVGGVLLYGGCTGTKDTWKFKAGVWKQIFPKNRTSYPMCDDAMAYDPNASLAILFGGPYSLGHPRPDWKFAGVPPKWSTISSPVTPPLRVIPPKMTWDAADFCVLLTDWADQSGNEVSTTWQFQ